MLKDMYSEVKYSFEHTHCNDMYMRLFAIERQKQEAESDVSVVESDVKSFLSDIHKLDYPEFKDDFIYILNYNDKDPFALI